MTVFTRHRTEIITGLVLAALFAGLTLLLFGQHADSSFITYRVARNLAAGHGLTLNADPRLLPDAVSPLYAALLAALSGLTPDFPFLGNLVGAISLALGAFALYAALYPVEKVAAGGAAALFLALPLLWHQLGLDAPFWLALCLLAVWTHLREWAIPTALLLAAATLTRPESAILVLILLAHAIATGRRFDFVAAGLYGGIVALGMVVFGSLVDAGGALPGLPGVGGVIPYPDTLADSLPAGVFALAAGQLALSPLWTVAALLAIPGLLQLAETPLVPILGGWALLHVVILSVLGVAPTALHLVPLLPALATMIALGGAWLAARVDSSGLRLAVAGIAALIVAGAAADSLIRLTLGTPQAASAYRLLIPQGVTQPYTDAGAWLAANTAPGAAVGASRIGMLGYLSDRPLIDASGMLQPEIAAARARQDGGWWLGELAPPTLALTASELADLPGYEAAADPWFRTVYTEAARFGPESDPLIVYTRAADPQPLSERLVGMVTFPGDLVLNSIATDFSLDPLNATGLRRVRLEWLLNAPLDGPRYVSISVQHREGAYAALSGNAVNFNAWPTRQLLTTYHTVEVQPNLPSGVYDVNVGIGPDATNLTWRTLTIAKVPFESEVYVGGLSGSRADFGRIALQGYRLSRRPPAELEVLLLWEAVEAPRVDYDVLIQVRAMGGAVVLQQTAEPSGGAYPTSVWSPGERVPDTYTLDITGLAPGDYEVFAGVLDPDGSRLLTLDGRDAVLVGRTTITP